MGFGVLGTFKRFFFGGGGGGPRIMFSIRKSNPITWVGTNRSELSQFF